MKYTVAPQSETAKAVAEWAQDGLAECRKAMERTETTWDNVVALRREIKRLTKLVEFVTHVESSE